VWSLQNPMISKLRSSHKLGYLHLYHKKNGKKLWENLYIYVSP
jgi:hypothetical protein